MIRGGLLVTFPSALGRPPEFMAEEATEFIRWKTTMEKFKVYDVEFEEDHLEVVRLTANPH